MGPFLYVFFEDKDAQATVTKNKADNQSGRESPSHNLEESFHFSEKPFA